MAADGAAPLSLPESVILESTNVCNIKCKMCFQSLAEYQAPRGFMSRELFVKCLDEIKRAGGFHCIQLSLFGEPLLHPEIVDFVRIGWQEYGLSVYFSSNALLLDPGMSEQLVKAGLRALSISLDAASAEVYERIRRGSAHGQVMENLRTFIAVRNRLNQGRPRNLPTLSVKFAMQAENMAERQDFRKMIQDIDPEIEVVFQPLLNWHTATGPEYSVKKRLVCSLGQAKHYLCVTWDGAVIPCCMDFNRSTVLGNCHESTLQEIYHGPACQGLLRLFREKAAGWEDALPAMCGSCCYHDRP